MRHFAPLALALIVAVLPLAAVAQERLRDTPPGVLDIMNNRGGNVLQAISKRNELERWGGQVRIRGYCRSACTIYTTLPNACIARQARIGFHAPRIPNTDIIPPLVDQMMGEFYRNGIRDRWFGGWNRSLKMHIISAQDYVRLDPQTRLCGPGPQG